MTTQTPEPVIQLTMNGQEAMFVCWVVYLGQAIVAGDFIAQLEGITQTRVAIQNMDADSYNAFIKRLDRLMKAGFPEFKDASNEPIGSTIGISAPAGCPHCPCSDPICCLCGAVK